MKDTFRVPLPGGWAIVSEGTTGETHHFADVIVFNEVGEVVHNWPTYGVDEWLECLVDGRQAHKEWMGDGRGP